MADRSPFTIEQRLVTAVWLHERPHTDDTVETVRVKFRERFGMEPPRKATMLGWGKHAFTMESEETTLEMADCQPEVKHVKLLRNLC
ncbi:hypothetical protein BsWGS_07348 [Bradybaena similaris]